MIQVDGLSKSFGQRQALQRCVFEVPAGHIVGLVGKNGAGKTTALRILSGQLLPSAGEVWIDGHALSEEGLAIRSRIGYLPETPPLYPEMDVHGYLKYVATIQDVPRGKRTECIDRALERCGLADVRRRLIGALSKGYRQRVGLAGAIVHMPPVLVLDEPTVGLDPIQIQEIRALIKELGGAGEHAVILSTHILAEVEAICDRVILIHRGRKVEDSPLADLVAGGRRLEELFARETARDVVGPAGGAPPDAAAASPGGEGSS